MPQIDRGAGGTAGDRDGVIVKHSHIRTYSMAAITLD